MGRLSSNTFQKTWGENWKAKYIILINKKRVTFIDVILYKDGKKIFGFILWNVYARRVIKGEMDTYHEFSFSYA